MLLLARMWRNSCKTGATRAEETEREISQAFPVHFVGLRGLCSARKWDTTCLRWLFEWMKSPWRCSIA